MDIELILLKRLFNLKENKIKEYNKLEGDKNIIYVFNDYNELKEYFISNGCVNITDELIKICIFKKLKNKKIIAFKGLCDHIIYKVTCKKSLSEDTLMKYYLNKLGYNEIPEFLSAYLKVPSLERLKNIGYFCGMDYASKSVYNFKEYITRYDHSLSTALITYKLTKDKKATLAALFHDIATPCFSHVIDYMNGDFAKQESTEEYTERIIKRDKKLIELLKENNINIEDIINFKKYTVVDNERPKLCADRIDGIILTGISWTKSITKTLIDEILNSLTLYNNEFNELEIGFNNYNIGNKVFIINEEIDDFCHSNYDNYMMILLSKIVKHAISSKYIEYDDLYTLSEKDILELLKHTKDNTLKKYFQLFENIKKEDIPTFDLDNLKKRDINPLINGKRLINNKTTSITKNYK